MKYVTIKDFHSKMWDHIKDLPIIVTRNGLPSFVVIPWNQWEEADKALGEQPIATDDEENTILEQQEKVPSAHGLDKK